MNPSESTALMLIGAGYHARDIYLPCLAALRREYGVHLAAIVDFESVLNDAVDYAHSHDLLPTCCIAAAPFSGQRLPSELEQRLSHAVREHNIEAVIIATPPEAHRPYASWALEMKLNILLDKPITTRPNAAHRIDAAIDIYHDFQALRTQYTALQRKKDTAFLIHTTRRFHPAFLKVMELIGEIKELTNCPVTSIYSSHCDGQLRLPGEMIDLDYHGYNQGIGVVSHSGYHIIDIACQMLEAGAVTDKQPDRMDIFSSFVTPNGVLLQMKDEDYSRVFPDYSNATIYPEQYLYAGCAESGEVDAFVSIDLMKDNQCLGHASIEMLHNGFSQRKNAAPNHADLYKGMGRLNQEYHNIQQGPFQNVQMHSFQSKSPQNPSNEADYDVGGNNHRDILVFRNSNLLGLERYRKIAMNDLMPGDPSSSVAKIVEGFVVEEFVRFLCGRISRSELRSNIDSHWLPVAMMSGIYVAFASRSSGGYPVISVDLCEQRIGVVQSGLFQNLT